MSMTPTQMSVLNLVKRTWHAWQNLPITALSPKKARLKQASSPRRHQSRSIALAAPWSPANALHAAFLGKETWGFLDTGLDGGANAKYPESGRHAQTSIHASYSNGFGIFVQ